MASCPLRGGGLEDADHAPRVVHQVEIIDVPIRIEAHRGRAYWCPSCRKLHYAPLPPDEVLEATTRLFDVDQAAFAQPRSAVLARDITAWLARRLTNATLRELAAPFGLTHPDSVANLTRRAERAMEQRPRLRRQVETLRKTLLGAHHTT